jgi:hypothetical protein
MTTSAAANAVDSADRSSKWGMVTKGQSWLVLPANEVTVIAEVWSCPRIVAMFSSAASKIFSARSRNCRKNTINAV